MKRNLAAALILSLGVAGLVLAQALPPGGGGTGSGVSTTTANNGLSFVSSAGANTVAFAAGDGGMYCYEGSCKTRAHADGGFSGVNIVSGLYSQAQFLDTGSNSAFTYQALKPDGTACGTGNIFAWYAGSSRVLSLGCNQTLTATAISSNGAIQTDTFEGKSSSSTVLFEGNKSDDATAIAMAFGNSGAYTTVGDQLISVRNGSAASTEVGYVLPTGLSSLWTQHPVTGSGKRNGQYTITLNSDSTFAATQLPSPTLYVAGVVANAATADGTLNMIDYPTTAVGGNASGINGPYTSTRFDFRPRLTAVVRTGATITNLNIFICLSDADVSAVTTLSDLNARKALCAVYSPSGAGLGGGSWTLVTSDASTASASSTSIAVAVSTTYVIDLDMSRSGGALLRVNNAATSAGGRALKTTNIPTGATDIGINVAAVTQNASAKDFYIGKVDLEQN